MDKFDRKFIDLISDRDGVPEGYERRVEGRLATLPERAGAAEAGARRRVRPAVAAIAAVLAVCLITGTALAVSPGFRQLLWGGFEPYVQELESTPENTQVYDGVEARIVSALSDGYINTIHLEFRDLEGDRVRDAWREYEEKGDKDFLRDVIFYIDAETDAMTTGGLFAGNDPQPIGFDGETGVMTVECLMSAAIPLDVERTVEVKILSGAFGTETITEGGEPQGQGFAASNRGMAWQLRAKLTAIDTRSVDVGTVAIAPESAEASRFIVAAVPEGSEISGFKEWAGVERVELEDENMYFHTVEISQLGITMNRDGDINDADGYFEYRSAPEELTVKLRDGTVMALDRHLGSTFQMDGESVSSEIWLFPEPVDPDAVASVTLGGVEIQLD